MKMKRIYCFVFVFICCFQAIFAQKVDLESLLREMVDRNERARFPEAMFTCKQASSYDRATVAKDKPGWFANNDRSMFMRKELTDGRTEYVMMDVDGPGAVVRFWMTFGGPVSGKGTMRIYIDDYSNPAIEGTPFDIISGNIITGPPLASSVSELTEYEKRGHNLYFPIPYAKRCKITYQSDHLWDDDPGATKKETERVYYNINYRTYEPSAHVVSYSLSELRKNEMLIKEVQRQLRYKTFKNKDLKQTSYPLNLDLSPGESQSITIKGSKAIQHLSLKLKAMDAEQALRSTILDISFDGEKTVWSPIGDFFGIGYHQLYTNTWYLKSEKNGQMDAYWVMPFKDKCIITIRNLGDQKVKIENAFVECGSWKWDDRSMHFGTTWQQYTHLPVGPHEHSAEVNFATLHGCGVYVGDCLSLMNTSYQWWGEGDEKIYIDGENFPSHIGTGTEDYYGYAWCRPEIFTDHPFIAQPSGSGNFTPGYTVNSRFRGLDGISFKTSLIFDMEVFHWDKTRINYAPVAYWYMKPGGKKMTKEDIRGAMEKVAKDRKDIYPSHLSLNIEAEDLHILYPPNKSVRYQYNEEYSNNTIQVFWENVQENDKIYFTFNSPFAGTFEMSGLFSLYPKGGYFNIYVNDQLCVSNIRLASDRIEYKSLNLAQVELKTGENTLLVELIKAVKINSRSTIGMDKLYFIPL